MKYEITKSGFNILFNEFGLLRFDVVDDAFIARIKEKHPSIRETTTGVYINRLKVAVRM